MVERSGTMCAGMVWTNPFPNALSTEWMLMFSEVGNSFQGISQAG